MHPVVAIVTVCVGLRASIAVSRWLRKPRTIERVMPIDAGVKPSVAERKIALARQTKERSNQLKAKSNVQQKAGSQSVLNKSVDATDE